MPKLPCHCGKMVKQFKFDLGVKTYFESCCDAAGFNPDGTLKEALQAQATALTIKDDEPILVSGALPSPVESESGSRLRQLEDNVQKPPTTTAPAAPTARPPLRPGRGKLMDLTREQLNQIATELSIADFQAMNKKNLVEAILDKRG